MKKTVVPGFHQSTVPAKVILSANLITKDNAAKYYVPDPICYNLMLALSALPGRESCQGSSATGPAAATVMAATGTPLFRAPDAPGPTDDSRSPPAGGVCTV